MKGDVAYQGDHMFARRMFRWAAIYGVIVLTPMYFAPLPPQLHRLSDHVGRAKAGLQFFEKAVVETHGGGRTSRT